VTNNLWHCGVPDSGTLQPPPHHHNRFMALFLGPPRWAGARRELLYLMVQGKINRNRHTDDQAKKWSKFSLSES